MQDWLWNIDDEHGWFEDVIKISLGILQFYWIFLFSCLLIVLLVTIAIMICSCSLPPLRGNIGGVGQQSSRLERQETIDNLGKMSRLFDFSEFSEHKECVICLMPFTNDCMVTTLPCDERHYFHSKCIEEWSRNHHDCPLCKKPFNAEILADAIRNRPPT